mgnify:CR=1 FL=1
MWDVSTTDIFDAWFDALGDVDRGRVLASLLLLQDKGPMLSRPHADTIKGSKYPNMKELRVQSKGDPLRAFFAFDPKRKGIVLCAGNKTGKEKQFYERMIPIVDKEYANHLKTIG